jgi:type III secretion protein T
MEAILKLSRELDYYVICLIAALPRAHAFFDASQLLNSSVIPGAPRMAAIIAMMFFTIPINQEWAQGFDRSLTAYVILFAKEYAIGFLLGYVVAKIFWAVQAAGAFIDNQRGTAIASSIDPLLGEESSTLGNLFSITFTTYIFVSGTMLLLIGVLFNSFLLWPVSKGVPVVSDQFPVLALGMLDSAMKLMFVMAAPIIAIMFVAEFSLAIVSRFAPQVQVFVLAMPIKSLLAIIVLTSYISILYPFADKKLLSAPEATRALYETLKQGEKLLRSRPPSPEQPR